MPDGSAPLPVIDSKAELVEQLESGCKPRSDWRLGAEHEKFCYHREDLTPLAYAGEHGIRAVLEAFTPHGWAPVMEGEHIIGLQKDGASVSLEPGGQFELSGAPLKTIHDICDEVTTHLHLAKQVGETMNVGFLGLGFHPTLERAAVPIMPKGRYGLMRAYMPTKGNLGLDMMLRTCTVQVNLDFLNEADMVEKFRIALALQPVATVLFANSPFIEGKPNGFQSYRAHVWTDTDPDRTGTLPFVFDDGFGFERYVDYLLDVPMYFVKRNDRYVDCLGMSFRDFLDGRLPALPGEKPTMQDWKDHQTTVFPEVRLKTFLEMRGADGGPWSRLCALPALWAGLLYDGEAQGEALELIADITAEDRETMRADAARLGLAAPYKGATFHALARRVLEIGDGGLKRRAALSSGGDTEQGFLNALWETVDTGKTPADVLLDRYRGDWEGDISRIFAEFAY